MKSLYITIIIIILLCEIYLRYFDNTKNINEEIKNTDMMIIPEPWDKIKKKPNYNSIEQKLKYDYVQFCKTIRFLLFF